MVTLLDLSCKYLLGRIGLSLILNTTTVTLRSMSAQPAQRAFVTRGLVPQNDTGSTAVILSEPHSVGGAKNPLRKALYSRTAVVEEATSSVSENLLRMTRFLGG